MREFKSKTDLWLGLTILMSALISLVVSFGMAVSMNALGVVFAVVVFVAGVVMPLWILFGTRYIVSADNLRVKSGPFTWDIAISSITAVKNSKNPLSSPALSLDRLHIQYQQGKSLMVSPKNRDEFLVAIDQLPSDSLITGASR